MNKGYCFVNTTNYLNGYMGIVENDSPVMGGKDEALKERRVCVCVRVRACVLLWMCVRQFQKVFGLNLSCKLN